MAIIKALETNFGDSANYWRVVQINQNSDRTDFVVILAGYMDENARRSGKTPMNSVQFDFSPFDHPIAELDPNLVDEARLSEWTDFDKHLAYLHIKVVASVAAGKVEEERTANERAAVAFSGATDAY